MTSTLRWRAICASPAGKPRDGRALEVPELVEVEHRRAEGDAVRGKPLRLLLHRRDMQERLGRNAADIEAHAAERRVLLDQHDAQAEIGRAERRRIAARPAAAPPKRSRKKATT